MKKLLTIIRSVVFICLLLLITAVLNHALSPYWRYSDDPDEAGESDRYELFYTLERNSLDYLVLGPSNSYHSIDPMQVYARGGHTGYDLGSPSQTMGCSYYWLLEALKYQNPAVVFVDTGSFAREVPNAERILKCLIPMRPSLLKLKAIEECTDEKDVRLTALFPLYEFHSRWEEFSLKDARRVRYDPYLIRGATVRFVSLNEVDADKMNLREHRDVYLDEDGKAFSVLDELSVTEASPVYFREIAKECSARGIKCVPVKFPTKNWDPRWSALTADAISSTGLQLIDLTGGEEGESIGINWKKDSFDNGRHLNYFGMVKTSAWLSDFLEENAVEAAADEAVRRRWDEDLEKYGEWEADRLLSEEDRSLLPSLSSDLFLSSLSEGRENYIILISVKYDASEAASPYAQAVLKDLGFSCDFSSLRQLSFLGISEGGKALFEYQGEDILFYDSALPLKNGGKAGLHLESGGPANISCLEVDGQDYSLKQRGINLAVLDRDDGQVLASAAINQSGQPPVKIRTYGQLKDSPLTAGDSHLVTLKPLSAAADSSITISSQPPSQDASQLPSQNASQDASQVPSQAAPQAAPLFSAEYRLTPAGDGNVNFLLTEADSSEYLCVDSGGNSDGTKVLPEPDCSTIRSRYLPVSAGGGKYLIRSAYNGMYLTFSPAADKTLSPELTLMDEISGMTCIAAIEQ